ncbi:MAG TPA: twin-arginine translocation signal domain-containing protein [Pyrinomonadaceae bacterium]|jgi:plastocyanin|nr:twin-arginine translocation signal domain-containing protein [Pyrinomonadaceae bacterium]
MGKTSRRNLLKGTAVAGVSAALGLTMNPEIEAAAEKAHKHQHPNIAGPLANATVSFGAWPTDPPSDRFDGVGQPTKPNVHQLIPHEVKIKAGGSVNFIISGFHLVLVYDDGTQPADIDTTLLVPGFPPGMIDDPDGRIYRGLDPRLAPLQLQERTEVVHFSKPGRYLVICGILPHFSGGMFGFVSVLA